MSEQQSTPAPRDLRHAASVLRASLHLLGLLHIARREAGDEAERLNLAAAWLDRQAAQQEASDA